jgi:hypothetical protein
MTQYPWTHLEISQLLSKCHPENDGLMLAKVSSINEQKNKVNVTLVDVDVLGSVIPVGSFIV